MIPPNSKIYLETSGVNFLADKYLGHDGKATKIYHDVKGTSFYISPVTIWEILLTKDSGRRETLIYYLQNLAHRHLINSPAEFIVNYISAGCPLTEIKYDFHSKSSLSKTWTDICDNPAKTFVFDKNDLDKMSKSIRAGFSEASKMIGDLGITAVILGETEKSQYSLEQLLRSMKTIDYENLTGKERKRFKISIILILIILCYNIGFEDNALDTFWLKHKIKDPLQRFEFVFRNYESLVYRGPFAILSEMAVVQLDKGAKPTRGIYWDILHSIYLVYTDYFFTADNHFKLLRDKNEHLNYKKIVFLPEVTVVTAKEIEIIGRPGIIE